MEVSVSEDTTETASKRAKVSMRGRRDANSVGEVSKRVERKADGRVTRTVKGTLVVN
jgi:hypothetical protein